MNLSGIFKEKKSFQLTHLEMVLAEPIQDLGRHAASELRQAHSSFSKFA